MCSEAIFDLFLTFSINIGSVEFMLKPNSAFFFKLNLCVYIIRLKLDLGQA